MGRGGQKRKRSGDSRGKSGGKGGKKGEIDAVVDPEGVRGKGQEQSGKRRGRSGPLPERAVLVSVNFPKDCPKGTREALRLLTAAMGEDADTIEDVPGLSVNEQLDAELLELQGGQDEDGKNRPRRMAFHCEPLRGVALISVPRHGAEPTSEFMAPSSLVKEVFKRQSESRAPRHVARMWPLDFVCAPHMSNFKAAVTKELPVLFGAVQPDDTWNLAFNSRAMGTIRREDTLALLKQILQPLGLDLSCSDPTYTVLIEVNPVLCGFSVLQGYEETFHECHLRAAAMAGSDDDEATAQRC